MVIVPDLHAAKAAAPLVRTIQDYPTMDVGWPSRPGRAALCYGGDGSSKKLRSMLTTSFIVEDSGVDESVTTKFPGSTVTVGSAASGAGDNREIPVEEGGDFDKLGRCVNKHFDYCGCLLTCSQSHKGS